MLDSTTIPLFHSSHRYLLLLPDHLLILPIRVLSLIHVSFILSQPTTLHIQVPLFEVTIDPSSNYPLHCFLTTVVGFDCVDDESKPEPALLLKNPPPADEWDGKTNPPYVYWMYVEHTH